jgi:hypothetical protein
MVGTALKNRIRRRLILDPAPGSNLKTMMMCWPLGVRAVPVIHATRLIGHVPLRCPAPAPA